VKKQVLYKKNNLAAARTILSKTFFEFPGKIMLANA
jgi:hypothetical protein